MRVAEWIPLVEISEDAKGYLIKAELPQVKKEDVKITMEDGTLTITGERKFEKNSKKNHRVARAYGKFVYSFSLPDDASPAKVTAEFKGGVLKVHLAKNKKTNPGKSRLNLSRRKLKHERSKTEASPTPTK
jgi:HSP20 family protein